jgi:hypothetical protein
MLPDIKQRIEIPRAAFFHCLQRSHEVRSAAHKALCVVLCARAAANARDRPDARKPEYDAALVDGSQPSVHFGATLALNSTLPQCLKSKTDTTQVAVNHNSTFNGDSLPAE